MIEHIFIFSSHEAYPQQAVDLALLLSKGYNKPICFLSYLDKKIKASKAEIENVQQQWAEKLSDLTPHPAQYKVLDRKEDFAAFMEQAEASMVIFQLSENTGYNKVPVLLKISRELRVPYIFVKPYFKPVQLRKVLVPVSFLIEDREKGPFSSSMGRFFDAELLMMPAKDYGSKAQNNTNAICTLLDKFNLTYSFIKAQKDSFKVEQEAIRRTQELQADMVIISASREYGLDDIVFGPKELHCINEASVPVMLINPRADLYVLCG
jgi:nucleotide-binding universal stress UspA family protein